MKPRICLDFDGVLAEYHGWQPGKPPGPPLPSARAAVILLAQEYEVVILSSRDTETIRAWLNQYDFPPLDITNHKLPASLYIDDRAIRFPGKWDLSFLADLRYLRPWWDTTGDGDRWQALAKEE